MQIPVLVEPTSPNTFRAITGGPLRLQTDAATREEAVRKLRDLVQRRLDAGAELVGIEVPASAHPLGEFAGMLKNEPLLGNWRDARAEYRRARESEDNTP